MIGKQIRLGIDDFADALFGGFDPKKDGLPDIFNKPKSPEPKRKEKPPPPPPDEVTFCGRRWKVCTPPDVYVFEYENLSLQTNGGRVANLTEWDLEELDAADLDRAKAEMIKPLWANEQTNSQILTALNGDAEKYGLGKRTIEKYTSAFSRAFQAEFHD